jgi:hypothetical protein
MTLNVANKEYKKTVEKLQKNGSVLKKLKLNLHSNNNNVEQGGNNNSNHHNHNEHNSLLNNNKSNRNNNDDDDDEEDLNLPIPVIQAIEIGNFQ